MALDFVDPVLENVLRFTALLEVTEDVYGRIELNGICFNSISGPSSFNSLEWGVNVLAIGFRSRNEFSAA